MKQPIHRSDLRLKCGMLYYGALRKLMWLRCNHQFAKTRAVTPLPYTAFAHETILRRPLKDVEMWMQENKIINLNLAVPHVHGILLAPGETFSYWKCIGKPSKRKGYVDGMILRNGTFTAGTGGGLCQLANLIFWMTLHTPLTVIERHRHGYDVFPDSNRTQPFGSGATCFYPHGDLMIRNDTQDTYQLLVTVGNTHLEGAWQVSEKPEYRYEIVERNHKMEGEYWGGYSRHNQLYQQSFDSQGALVYDYLVVENHAIMIYAPFLETKEKEETS
ncbi:VanW family protein [Bengtsoniella intestinalis]|uniref:VanW family protein n=1 Tax=Bengtsoniella intestinalis TaxID=3073143 RepID=UPI00391F7C9B